MIKVINLQEKTRKNSEEAKLLKVPDTCTSGLVHLVKLVPETDQQVSWIKIIKSNCHYKVDWEFLAPRIVGDVSQTC